MNSRTTLVMAWRLHRSAIAACLVYFREIDPTVFWEFCNTIGTKRTFKVLRRRSDVEGRADMARTLPEGDPRYATDFLPRMDGAGCPGGGGASGSWWPGRALARNHVRRSSLEYSGLRGEGSTPGPLPPPGCPRRCVLRANSLANKPSSRRDF